MPKDLSSLFPILRSGRAPSRAPSLSPLLCSARFPKWASSSPSLTRGQSPSCAIANGSLFLASLDPYSGRFPLTPSLDNSPSNPENADPTKEVTWGEQSWDEMMVGFFNLVFDPKMPVANLLPPKSKNKADIASK